MINNDMILKQLQDDLTSTNGTHSQIVQKVETSQSVYDAYNARVHHSSALDSAGFTTSGMKMKDVKRAVEGSLPDLAAPFLAEQGLVSVTPKTANAVTTAQVLENIINNQYSYGFNKVKFIEDLCKNVQIEGTVFTKVGWSDDRPTVEYVPIMEVIVDPSAKSLDEASYVIQRRKVSINDILTNPQWYGEQTLDSLHTLEAAVTSTQYDNIKYERDGYDSSKNYEDRLRTQVELFEYYGMMDINDTGTLEPVLCIWADNLLLHAIPSPYPDEFNGIPFEVAVYTRNPFSIYGDSLPEMINDYQNVRDALMRGVIDNMALANNGQKFVQKGAMDQMNYARMMRGEKVIYMNKPPSESFVDGSYNEIPSSVFHLMEQMKTEQEELSGISRMNGGVDPRALHSTATGASIANDNSKKRIISITRHISEMLERVLYKWLLLNQELLQDGVAQVNGEYTPVNAQLIQGQFDLTVGTAGLDTTKMNNINMMMTAMSGAGDNPVSNLLVIEMAKILDLPLVAQKLTEQMEAGPNQEQQMAQQMAMSIEMKAKEADIANTNADTMKKMAESQESIVDAQNSSFGL